MASFEKKVYDEEMLDDIYDRVIAQVRWSYKIGTIREISRDTVGELAEWILTEEEFDAFVNAGLQTIVYQNA